MTSLDRPGCFVTRRTRDFYNILYASKKRQKRIVVTLLYGDLIEFREERGQARFTVPIANAFRYALNCEALRIRREKAEKVKTKKAEDRRTRQEKKLFQK
jgi:hypothetical protein